MTVQLVYSYNANPNFLLYYNSIDTESLVVIRPIDVVAVRLWKGLNQTGLSHQRSELVIAFVFLLCISLSFPQAGSCRLNFDDLL